LTNNPTKLQRLLPGALFYVLNLPKSVFVGRALPGPAVSLRRFPRHPCWTKGTTFWRRREGGEGRGRR